MSLDLPHIVHQVQQFGEATSQRISTLQQQLPALTKAFIELEKYELGQLEERFSTTPETWQGAVPPLEPITTQVPPPQALDEIDIIAADGSQIYPDRHSPLLYYLINIGGISLPYGSQRPPRTFSRPKLYYDSKDLFDAGHLVSTAIINGHRDVAELSTLVELVGQPSTDPTLALLDNSLQLRLAAGNREQISKTAHQLMKDFVHALTQMQQSGANLAGYIDRPGGTDLLHSVALLSGQGTSNTYPGLLDRDLMGQWLQPLHRSAVFLWKSLDFPEASRAGHSLHFFYLNLGHPDAIARIEIPKWVAEDQGRIQQVHAGILRDSQATGGYPYSLIRAHELAVVTQQERVALEQWLVKNLIDIGLPLNPSQKAITKGWLGRRRRHHV